MAPQAALRILIKGQAAHIVDRQDVAGDGLVAAVSLGGRFFGAHFQGSVRRSRPLLRRMLLDVKT